MFFNANFMSRTSEIALSDIGLKLVSKFLSHRIFAIENIEQSGENQIKSYGPYKSISYQVLSSPQLPIICCPKNFQSTPIILWPQTRNVHTAYPVRQPKSKTLFLSPPTSQPKERAFSRAGSKHLLAIFASMI